MTTSLDINFYFSNLNQELLWKFRIWTFLFRDHDKSLVLLNQL